MLMFQLLVLVCWFTASVHGRPTTRTSKSNTTEALARYYARLHPNSGEPIVECGRDISEMRDSNIAQNPLNAVRESVRRWPNGNVYYTLGRQFTGAEVREIQSSIDELTRLTSVARRPCIRVLPRRNQRDYITVEKLNGCWSYVGRTGANQNLSLGNGCVYQGIIMHEFLHALGFHHEQSRHDRDDFVTINWNNIDPGQRHNFNIVPDYRLKTPYDYDSVMHYAAYSFAINPRLPTIIPRNMNAMIGNRRTLSTIDIERVQLLYGCKTTAETEFFRHYRHDDLMALYE